MRVGEAGDAVGTKVSGRFREGSRLSGVAIKRGSNVHFLQQFWNKCMNLGDMSDICAIYMASEATLV